MPHLLPGNDNNIEALPDQSELFNLAELDSDVRKLLMAFPNGLAIDVPVSCQFAASLDKVAEESIVCSIENGRLVISVGSAGTESLTALLQALDMPGLQTVSVLCG